MINKFGIQQACNGAIKYVSDNSATILTCLGTIGVISTAVMSAKAVPKAQLLLEEKEEFKIKEYGEPLTKFERMLAVIPAYVPALLMGTATVACILGSNHINKQEQAALHSAYAYLNCSFNEYREKVKTLFGEDKEKEVRDAIRELCERTKEIRNGKYKINGGNDYDKNNETNLDCPTCLTRLLLLALD